MTRMKRASALPGDQYGVTEATKVRILYPTQSFDRAALSYAGTLQRSWADSVNMQLYRQSNERELVNDIDIGPVAPGFPNSGVLANCSTRRHTLQIAETSFTPSRPEKYGSRRRGGMGGARA
ncbi:MAG TPA: hypothetical protein VKB93_21785 [Thermoanaerobaculia bacterium]|nr:hypothetical protein [Thermoanaerobaculia bacterium]